MVETRCGGCGHTVPTGDPVQVVTLPGVSRLRYRCPACADSAVPADLPPLVARVIEPAWRPLVPIPSGVGLLPLDWKARGAGEREPGEEG